MIEPNRLFINFEWGRREKTVVESPRACALNEFVDKFGIDDSNTLTDNSETKTWIVSIWC